MTRPPQPSSRVPSWGYSADTESRPYGLVDTYVRSAHWLDGHGTVEDWGCGLAYAKRFFRRSPYIAIDASDSAFNDVTVDLVEYCSQSPCIMIRHVLEHDYQWKRILNNALASFTKRMTLVLFIKPGLGSTRRIKTGRLRTGETVPYLCISNDHLTAMIAPYLNHHETVSLEGKSEIVYYLDRHTAALDERTP